MLTVIRPETREDRQVFENASESFAGRAPTSIRLHQQADSKSLRLFSPSTFDKGFGFAECDRSSDLEHEKTNVFEAIRLRGSNPEGMRGERAKPSRCERSSDLNREKPPVSRW